MPTVIVIHSFRRGTGKTSLVANLAALCAREGKRVGLVDFNVESPSLHFSFHLKESEITCCLNDVLWQSCTTEQATYDVTARLDGGVPGKIFLVPASTRFVDISRILKGDFNPEIMNECVPELIEKNNLDFVFVDTRAGLTDDTLAAIAMTDILCIIMRPDAQDFQGTAVTVDLGRRLEVPRLLMIANLIPKAYDPAEVAQEIEQTYHCEVAAALPLNPDMLSLTSTDIFVETYPENPLTRALQQLLHK
jgi:MinD-like ATPase involved in chromosome partitioning or flagellar assembly